MIKVNILQQHTAGSRFYTHSEILRFAVEVISHLNLIRLPI